MLRHLECYFARASPTRLGECSPRHDLLFERGSDVCHDKVRRSPLGRISRIAEPYVLNWVWDGVNSANRRRGSVRLIAPTSRTALVSVLEKDAGLDDLVAVSGPSGQGTLVLLDLHSGTWQLNEELRDDPVLAVLLAETVELLRRDLA
jgi:hypothetical protein